MSYELFMEYYQQVQEILANNTFQEYGIIGLFLNALLSATALPLPTEILTSALLMGGEPELYVGIALIVGSVIGGFVNYSIGFSGNRLVNFIKRRKQKHVAELVSDFNKEPIKESKSERKPHKFLEKFGWGAIFFASWIPVIGDLILISAGVKRMKFSKFSIFMVAGKIVKTVVVVTGLGTLF
jgi:membrane protein YqaA with SNARE-associated domain